MSIDKKLPALTKEAIPWKHNLLAALAAPAIAGLGGAGIGALLAPHDYLVRLPFPPVCALNTELDLPA